MTASSSQPSAGHAAAKDKLARFDQWIDAYPSGEIAFMGLKKTDEVSA